MSTWVRTLGLVACALLPLVAAAQLTESEKRLLNSAISNDSATESGKRGDAAALERIVALGDPGLVSYFGRGMQLANTSVNVWPPEVEAVVVKHFDNPKVGPALRAMPGKYTTRKIFDLHLARIRATYSSDETSFEQILRTDQAGIEDDLLTVANRFPPRSGSPGGAADWLGRRKHPGVVPLLLGAIEGGYTPPFNTASYNTALDLLLAYPSEEVWRKAGAEVERLKGQGKLRDDQYAWARGKLDPLLKDPRAAIERMRGSDAWAEYVKRRDALVPYPRELQGLMKTAPEEYVRVQAGRLERINALAAEYTNDQVAYEQANQWGALGVYVRFRLGDPKRAIEYLERAAKGRDVIGQLVLADTYQLALGDKPNALRAYRLALDTASQPAGSRNVPYGAAGTPMNEFWKAWLAAEIEFLRSGKRFSGRVPEAAITGFWEAMGFWVRGAAYTFPDWPVPYEQLGIMSARGGTMGVAAAGPQAPTWATINYHLGQIDRTNLAQRLQAAPASRYALLVTLRQVSALTDPDAILRELARSDSSGYWTTVILGTVAFHESSPARRDEALLNGVAEALPGMAAAGKPNALASAARKHMQARALRVVERRK